MATDEVQAAFVQFQEAVGRCKRAVVELQDAEIAMRAAIKAFPRGPVQENPGLAALHHALELPLLETDLRNAMETIELIAELTSQIGKLWEMLGRV